MDKYSYANQQFALFLRRRTRNVPSQKIHILHIQNMLYIHSERVILETAKQRRSILVVPAVFQEGPKNPLKGTSMKSLVPA